jgi:hypothetical protein
MSERWQWWQKRAWGRSMIAYWGWIAPIIAVAITVAAMQAAVVLTGTIRRRDYRLFEDQSRESITRQFPLASLNQSQADERRKAIAPFLDKVHKAANEAQTTYHNSVVRSVGCLVLGFLGLVIGTIPQQDWPRALAVHHELIESTLTWLDAIAIISVLVLFLYARRTGQRWIAARTGVELLRQYQYLNFIFPDANVAPDANEVKTRFDIEASKIRERVEKGSIAEIVSRTERFWSERKVEIKTRALKDSDIQPDALQTYLQRRARRQLGWFTDSKARLEHIGERRTTILLTLYGIAALLVVMKLLFFICSGHSPGYLLPPLLIVTGMSAAMTAYYINQNTRSVIHRYRTQQRQIIEWLTAFNDRWKLADLPSLRLDAASKKEVSARIIEFENLMVEELIDWIHITSYDAIELAP